MTSSHHGRPSLSKSHTFPTSTEASNGQGNHVHSSSYDWSTNGAPNHQYHQGICFDTRSLPPTPMTTNTPSTHPFSSPPPPSYMSKYYMATAAPNGAPHYVASHPSLQHHYPPRGNDYVDAKYHPAGTPHARDVSMRSESFPAKTAAVTTSDSDGHPKASPVTNDSTSASYTNDRHGTSPPSSGSTSATAAANGNSMIPYHGLGITTAVETSSQDQAASPVSPGNNDNDSNNTKNATRQAHPHSRPEHAQGWPSPSMSSYAANPTRAPSSKSARSDNEHPLHDNVTSIPRSVTSGTAPNSIVTAAAAAAATHNVAAAFPAMHTGYSDAIDSNMRSVSTDYSKKRARDAGGDDEESSSSSRDTAAPNAAAVGAGLNGAEDGDVKRRRTVFADARSGVNDAAFPKI